MVSIDISLVAALYCIDHVGHGHSPGLRCYIPRFDDILQDFGAFVHSVAAANPGIPLVLPSIPRRNLVTGPAVRVWRVDGRRNCTAEHAGGRTGTWGGQGPGAGFGVVRTGAAQPMQRRPCARSRTT